jgi:LuxR family maltose regulon positive regulatory protein
MPKARLVQPQHPDLLERLTQRELEVLELLALRLTNKEIAQALAISPGTAKQHTRSVFQKLHAENRRDVIVQARNMGFHFDAIHPA